MANRCLLEISVDTLDGALAAQRAGAHRLELCGDLGVGGVTPDIELMRTVRAQVQLPIFSMVRPRAGNFLYSATEFESMKADVATAKSLHMDGVVLGILKNDRRVDVRRTQHLVELALPFSVTFHRAFDECTDLQHSLEDVIATGASRILTSGGALSAIDGVDMLADLVDSAQDRILILPGAGINPSNIALIAKKTRATEFHSGLSSSLPRPHTNNEKFAAEIRKLAEILAAL